MRTREAGGVPMFEVLYYTNGRGGAAISLDGGEHVILKNGRKLLQEDTIWVESDVDEAGPLSEIQEQAISDERARRAALSEDASQLDDIVSAYRKRRLREGVRNPTQQPKKPNRKLRDSVMVEYSSFDD